MLGVGHQLFWGKRCGLICRKWATRYDYTRKDCGLPASLVPTSHLEDQCIVGVQGAVRNKGPRETRYGRNSRYYSVGHLFNAPGTLTCLHCVHGQEGDIALILSYFTGEERTSGSHSSLLQA